MNYIEQMENFLYNIVFLRKKYGFSKSKMAKILGIGVKSLDKIENGELPHRLGVEVVYNMSDYFNIPVVDLFKKMHYKE